MPEELSGATTRKRERKASSIGPCRPRFLRRPSGGDPTFQVPSGLRRRGMEKRLGGTLILDPSMVRENPLRPPQQSGLGCIRRRDETFFVVATRVAASDSK